MDQSTQIENHQFKKLDDEFQNKNEIKNETNDEVQNLFLYCSEYQLNDQKIDIIENEISIKQENIFIVKNEEISSVIEKETRHYNQVQELSLQIQKRNKPQIQNLDEINMQLNLTNNKQNTQSNQNEVQNDKSTLNFNNENGYYIENSIQVKNKSKKFNENSIDHCRQQNQIYQSKGVKIYSDQESEEIPSLNNLNKDLKLESSQIYLNEESQEKIKESTEEQNEVVQEDSVQITKCKQKQRPKIITQITIESEDDEIKNEYQGQEIKKQKIKISKNIGPMIYQLKDKENKKKYGSFLRDQPDIIISHKVNSHRYKNLNVLPDLSQFNIKYFMFKVTWKRRNSGRIPIPNYYEYLEVKRIIPRLLLNYLEQLSQLKI